MDQDAVILTAVIAAIFAGVLGVLKLTLPYIARKRNGPPTIAPPAKPAANPTPLSPPGGTSPAEASGAFDALGDTGKRWASAPWKDFEKTLHGLQRDADLYATKEDLNAMSERFEKVEEKVDADGRETRTQLTSLVRAIGQLEGQLKK